MNAINRSLCIAWLPIKYSQKIKAQYLSYTYAVVIKLAFIQ